MEKPETQQIGPVEIQCGDLRVGYMDKVDFDHELGNAMGGNTVFPSIDDLEENKPCTESCGIVEVEIRLRRVIRESDFSKQIEKAKRRNQAAE